MENRFGLREEAWEELQMQENARRGQVGNTARCEENTSWESLSPKPTDANQPLASGSLVGVPRCGTFVFTLEGDVPAWLNYYEFYGQGILQKAHEFHLLLPGTHVFDGTFRLLARSWLPGLSSRMSPMEWTSMIFFRMSRLVRFLCVIMKDSRSYTTLRQNGGYAALTLQRPNVLTPPCWGL